MTIVYGTGASSLSWADARAKVRGDLWRPGTSGIPDDVCDRALHAALRRLESERRWLWLEGLIATITADVDGVSIDAPASLGSVSSLAYLSGTTGYDVLPPAPIASVRFAARGTIAGYPSAYALLGGKLYLDSAVSAGSEFELIFKARTPDAIEVAVADPPATLTLKQAAVIACAAADVSLSYLKSEDEAGRQEAKYQRHLEIMTNEEDEARGDTASCAIVPDMGMYNAAFGFGFGQ